LGPIGADVLPDQRIEAFAKNKRPKFLHLITTKEKAATSRRGSSKVPHRKI
jgi:hypothetical protein